MFDFLQIGQTVSPQSAPTTNLEVKNGMNCEHSPVDYKVSRETCRLPYYSLMKPRNSLSKQRELLVF